MKLNTNNHNEDQACFKWCMMYHQSKQEQHDDRITALIQALAYTFMCAIPTPPSYDDIIKFEDDNKLCINITFISQHNNEINPDQLGNLEYFKTGYSDSVIK
jgi:hypothetical protein